MDFDPKLFVGRTIKCILPLPCTILPNSQIGADTDMEGFVIICTDGMRLEIGAKMSQGIGFVIADAIYGPDLPNKIDKN